MKNKLIRSIVFVCIILTFLIPLIQLSIGFHFVVKDGQNASEQCSIAPDLPLLLSIGGVFTLLFLGIAYSLLHMIANNNPHSDTSGRIPKILVGLITFLFGTITFIFFLLIQIRIYDAYANGFILMSRPCAAVLIQGGLILIILTYINWTILLSIYVCVLFDKYAKQQRIRVNEFEMKNRKESSRF